MVWRQFEGALAGNVNHPLQWCIDLPSAVPRCLGEPGDIGVFQPLRSPPSPLCAEQNTTHSRGRRNFSLWVRKLEEKHLFLKLIFNFIYFYFFALDLVVVLLREGSNTTSGETNDTMRLPRCLLLLRLKRCHYFSPFVLDFCEPKGLEDFNGLSQRLRGPLYVKPQSHPRLYRPLFDFMKLILDRWYFYSSCLASPMAILM